ARRRAAAPVPRSARPRLFGDALRLEELRDRRGRRRPLVKPALDLRLVELDEGRLVLRVVTADDLEELAVARGARVGRHDAVDRVLLRADPRQPELHCHSITSSLSSSYAWTPTCASRWGEACRSPW